MQGHYPVAIRKQNQILPTLQIAVYVARNVDMSDGRL